jgi:hypothetical protein
MTCEVAEGSKVLGEGDVGTVGFGVSLRSGTVVANGDDETGGMTDAWG